MPRTPSEIDWTQVTVRFTPRTYSFLRKRGEEVGSLTEAVRRATEDSLHWYGLPDPIAQVLAKDAEAAGKNQRTYIQELLTQRYTQLLTVKVLENQDTQTPVKPKKHGG